MQRLSQPLRRQLLRVAGVLLCSPVLARAADNDLPRAVRQRILSTLDSLLPKVLNVHDPALMRRFNIGWSPVESGGRTPCKQESVPAMTRHSSLFPCCQSDSAPVSLNLDGG
ncbi:hypothetical protein JAB8_45100 [Janthinobacterium sp. HH106]|uniref:hypothetical protein n=1 Tax=Janthinobacterium sp. HH106 TaxID=1537278 RepID=UPI0008752A66|nr:hypothetical protein [Janthinobacterium sp. HH106]OEZ82927.1 hypothetical protein JAB8_45100 [Janthinobacterium sp. HH106]